MKLSESLKINSNNIRTREFVMAGQKLRVRIPLSAEMDAINERVKNTNFDEQYKKLSAPLLEKKEMLEGDEIKFSEDDIILNDRSIKEMAQSSAQTNARIVELFKLLVPVVDGANMDDLTYEEIEAEFPFSTQIEIAKKITEVISPGYEEVRKN